MKRIALAIMSFVGLCTMVSAQGIDTPASFLVGSASGLRVSGIDGSLSGSYSTVIRGLNSLRGDSAPLLIVDGVLIETPLLSDGQAFWQDGYSGQVYAPSMNLLGYLSVDDIASIEVLKDISATAVYGSRGANGVIIIKTKSSKEGEERLDWKSKGGFYMPGGYMHSHYLMANGSKGNNQFAASGFYRQEDDGYSLMDNHSGGARLMFLSSPGVGARFGVNTTFGAQRQSILNTTAYYGAASMGLDRFLGKDISSWQTDFDDYAVDYHISNNAFIDIRVLRSLNWHTQVSVDYQNTKRFTFYGEATDFGKTLESAAAVQSAYKFGYLASTELDFNQYIGLDHNLKLRIGAELSGNRAIYNTMNGTRLVAPHLRAKGLNLVSEFSRIRTFKPRYFHIAAFGILGYSYKDIAGLDATIRLDNTPKYDDSYVLLYPAVEAYVDLRKIALAEAAALSSLRVTAGWGAAGRENIVMYPLLDSFIPGDYPAIDYDSQSIINALDRTLSKEFNVGLSVGFLKNRIYGQVKYYDKATRSNLSVYNFASLNPQTQMWVYDYRKTIQTYVDGVSNRGLEVDLSFEPVVRDAIRWQITATSCFQSNQVSMLCKDDILGINVGKDELVTNVNALGYSIGSIYGYDVDQSGRVVDHIPDAEITPEDRIILGRTQPKVFGTLGTSLLLWNLNLSMLLDGAAGHNLLNLSAMIKDGAEYVTAKYVEKANFLRLSKLSLAYDIPVRNVRWIQDVEVSLSGHNLVCFTGYSGVNPDVDSFGISNFARGIDMGALPMYKAVLLGLSLKF